MHFSTVEVYNSTGKKDIISGIIYNEFGQMTDIFRGNKTDTHYTYDIKGRLSSLVTYTETNAQTRKLQDVSYTFKIDNSIAAVTNTPDVDTEGGYQSTVNYTYRYDGLNRLVKAAGIYTRGMSPNSAAQETVKMFETGWAYSLNGNMTGKEIFDPASHALEDSLEYTYGANNHAVTSITSRLTSEEKYAMQYDACGNMIVQTCPPNLISRPLLPKEKGSSIYILVDLILKNL